MKMDDNDNDEDTIVNAGCGKTHGIRTANEGEQNKVDGPNSEPSGNVRPNMRLTGNDFNLNFRRVWSRVGRCRREKRGEDVDCPWGRAVVGDVSTGA